MDFFKKTLIALTIVITLNFSLGYKKAEAFALSWGVGLGVSLLVAAGVTIANKDMALDLGGSLWETIKDLPIEFMEQKEKLMVKMEGLVLQATMKFIKDGNIPTEPVYKEKEEIVSLPHTMSAAYSELGTVVASFKFKTMQKEGEYSQEFTLDGYSVGVVTRVPQFDEFRIRLQGKWGGTDNTMVVVELYNLGLKVKEFGSTQSIPYLNPVSKLVVKAPTVSYKPIEENPTKVSNISIPYSPDTVKNVSDEGFASTLPVGSTLTFPKDVVNDETIPWTGPVTGLGDIGATVDKTGTDTGTGEGTGVIEGLLNSILEGIDSITSAITGIFIPPVGQGVELDLSPLYLSLSDKFPFCIPFDLFKSVESMVSERVAPTFEVEFPDNIFIGGGSIKIDFKEFDGIVLVLRYFILISFIVALIMATKGLIS